MEHHLNTIRFESGSIGYKNKLGFFAVVCLGSACCMQVNILIDTVKEKKKLFKILQDIFSLSPLLKNKIKMK